MNKNWLVRKCSTTVVDLAIRNPLIGDFLKTTKVDDVLVHVVEDISDAPLINLQRGYLLGLDCETNGTNAFADGFEVRLVQIANENEAYVFRMDVPWQVNYVTSVLSDDSTSFCSYTDADVMFVWSGLSVDISHRNLDLRSLATMAAPDDRLGGVDLKTVSVKYLKVKWLKDAQELLQTEMGQLYAKDHPNIRANKSDVASYGWSNIDLDNPIYTTYAGLDAIAARRLVPILIKATGAPFSLIKNQTWLDAEAARMRMRGMHVDVQSRDVLYNEVSQACDYHEEKFGDIVWEPIIRGRVPNKYVIEKPISPRSGKKVAMYLHKEGADFSGFPLTDKGIELLEKGELSTEDEVTGKYASLGKGNQSLVQLLNVSPEAERAIEHLFGFKEKIYTKTKLEEIAKIIDSDDVVHPVLRTCGTVTGRSSSSGPNTQNYSRTDTAMREIYVPAPGNVLLGADFAQIEVRVAAASSQDALLMEMLRSGVSYHEENMKALGLNKDKAKIFGFSLLYGAGPKAISKQTGLPYDICKVKAEIFWNTYPGLRMYRDRVSRETPDIRTISNRKIPVPYDWDKRQYRGYVNLNYKIQSAARELAMASWWRFSNSPGILDNPDIHVWAFVHDELVIETPEDQADFALNSLLHSMTFDFMGVPITSEGGVMMKNGRSCWTKL